MEGGETHGQQLIEIDAGRSVLMYLRSKVSNDADFPKLGSGLVDQSQKMTVAARAMAERKTVGHRS